MTLSPSALPAEPELRPLTEFGAAVRGKGSPERMPSLRDAAKLFRERFARQGVVRALRTADVASFAVPTRLSLGGAAGPIPARVTLIARMLVVQFEDFAGLPRTLVWEPLLADSVAETRLQAGLGARRVSGIGPTLVPRQLCGLRLALARCGLDIDQVDFVALGDLRGHDLRRLAGTIRPVAHEHQPRAALFPAATLLVQAPALEVARAPHPVQAPWYVPDGARDLREERLTKLRGDVELGPGVALLATPGLSAGHQSLVVNTRAGIWVFSSNGVASDSWQPVLSKIPGIRRSAEVEGTEAIVCAGAEDALALYDSMVLERSLADASRSDPRWLTILPDRELAQLRRQWPALPTFSHGSLEIGRLVVNPRPPG